jgi:chorismate synthase
MSSTFCNRITISIWGESHGPGIGVVIDNLPAGEYIDTAELLQFMERRAPKKDGTTTSRNEKDMPHIMSGLLDNRTTGTPLCAFINNTDQHSTDYGNLNALPRPGHADYTGAVRYRGFNDIRGGGHFSGRLTAPQVFAGGICGQILERRSIYTSGHILQIHNIKDTNFDRTNITKENLLEIRRKTFPVISDSKGRRMKTDIQKARDGGESLGGVIECATVNVPAGIGSPIFDGLENTIAQLIFGIPAIKGLEFGAGFDVAKMTGSQNNDEFYTDELNHVKTITNNHGGILGGISSGMPITLRVAVKPTPSISQSQKTVNMSTLKGEELEIKGRHDPCIVPRAVPCVESAVNIAILCHMLEYPHFTG